MLLKHRQATISGECDAFTGDMSAMVAKKWALDNDGSIEGGTWIASGNVQGASRSCYVMAILISRMLLHGYGMVWLLLKKWV